MDSPLRSAPDDLASRLAAIVESSDDAIVGKTLQGIVTSWNPGAERLFGYTAEEILGRPVAILVPADRLDEEPGILARIARGERVPPFETVRLRKDGTRVDVSVTISPVYDAHGQVVGASKIARDVSERKHAEARMQAQLARLHLLDHITRAIGEHQDIDSIYQVAVRSIEERMPLACACIGHVSRDRTTVAITHVGVRGGAFAAELAQESGRGLPIDPNGMARCANGTLVYEPDTPAVPLPFAARLARGGLQSVVLAPLRSQQGVFAVLIAARAQRHAFSSSDCEFLGQLSAHLALATHQAELLASVRCAYDELHRGQQATIRNERMRAVGEMASGVAHDIGNLLMPALHFGEQLLAEEAHLSDAGRSRLATLVQALQDVAAITGRLREFYRPRDVQQAMAPLSLNALVPQVVSISQARWSDMARRQGLEIEVQTSLGEVPSVLGSESEIREALLNLVLNAVDAMPRGGRLQLTTGITATDGAHAPASRGGAYLCVSDTGNGMDEDTLKRCLDPLFTTKGERGTGMGLAMVHSMAQRHGADLSIDSRPGAGTTITLRFPPVAQQPATPRAAASPPPPVLRVLVIDDDPLVLETLVTMLKAAGQQVTPAQGGAPGIDAFLAGQAAGQPFEAVFTDLGMPEVDGHGVARAIKQASPATPVILLSGWGEALSTDASSAGHFDLVMAKPPRLRDLRAALARFGARRTS